MTVTCLGISGIASAAPVSTISPSQPDFVVNIPFSPSFSGHHEARPYTFDISMSKPDSRVL